MLYHSPPEKKNHKPTNRDGITRLSLNPPSSLMTVDFQYRLSSTALIDPYYEVLRYWQTRTHCCGHIVAHVSWAAQTGKHLLRTQNVSEQNQEHFCVPDTKFVSATNVARVGKRGNICVGNNVSATVSRQQCVLVCQYLNILQVWSSYLL